MTVDSIEQVVAPIDRSFEDKQGLFAYAAAIGQKRAWLGYDDNVRKHLANLDPSTPNERNYNRDFQLHNALRVGDRHGLAMLAVEGYLYRRVEDGSTTQVTEAAENLNAFGLALSRNYTTMTHQGATGSIISSIEYLQGDKDRLSPDVNNYANQVLHALRARQVENRLRLGVKVGMSLAATAGVKKLASFVRS